MAVLSQGHTMEARHTDSGAVEYLTAESERGRQALQAVMQRSYAANTGVVPASWALARVVDGVPVTFALVDPDREMAYPGGRLRYAFLCDAATRDERRGEGHFRATVDHLCASLRQAGIPLLVTHGRCALYRPLGFGVFTHHCGIFVAPDQIERALGAVVPDGARQLLTVEEGAHLWGDLLLISQVRAPGFEECRAALLAAAGIARQCGKERILFEHPPAPSYGSRYPIHLTTETPLAALARACGGRVCVEGADPEGRSVPDADWIKVLDAGRLLRYVAGCLAGLGPAPPPGRVCFDTDAGTVTVESRKGALSVSEERAPGSVVLHWPGWALAQLITGYQSAPALCTILESPLEAGALALLDALFPPRWRFSRNESWTFHS